ncbi:MAG: hypothetical protein MNPFHGCM_02946 [Gemmatimonadaceae bacterium]|nr:hypothetical protein [Gemmatimonadaceae bacterium]
MALPVRVGGQRTAAISGGFVLRLGRDTVALETYERTPDRITGEIVLRVPKTTYVRYQYDLRPDGAPVRSTVRIDPSGSDKASAHTVRIDFRDDSIRITVDSASLHRVEVRARAPGSIPLIAGPYGTSYATYEWLIAGVADGDSVTLAAISPVTGRAGSLMFVRRSPRRADIDFFGETLMPVVLDGGGRILAVDAQRTTVRANAERADAIDVALHARQFGKQDREGKGLGVASPPDSVRTRIGGVALAIDYSSPRMRGRAILGDLLPYDVVWRTGANAATLLKLNGDLSIEGVRVPAGTYSLWTIPHVDGAELIVNAQHGQWGTERDAAKDLYRIPLRVSQAASPLEALVIDVTPDGDLRFRWSTFVWSARLSRIGAE